MIVESLRFFSTAARRLFRNWPALLTMIALYAGLLATIYLFITTREATVPQVASSIALIALAPAIFFLLQAMSSNFAGEYSAAIVLKKSVRDVWKLVIVSLPTVALGIALIYLLNKMQGRLPLGGANIVPAISQPPNPAAAQLWPAVVLTSIRYLVFWLAVPLILIHLWASVGRDGLLATLRNVKRSLAAAFAPQSVAIYLAGFLLFGAVPYLLLFKLTTARTAWLDIVLFGGRLAVLFFLTLLGWLLTAGALSIARYSQRGATEDA